MRPLLLLAAVAGSACSAPQLQITPRALKLDIAGEFAANSSGSTAFSNSLEGLGLTEDSTEFSPRIDFRAGGLQITADYVDAAYAGQGSVDGTIEFNGVVFDGTEEVNTELDLTLARGVATFDFIPSQLVDIGVGVGGGYADARVFIQGQTTGDTAETDEQVPFPFVAARAGVDVGPLSVEVLAGWLEVDIDDVQASYLDLDGMVRWTFLGGDEHFGGALVAGYRYIDLELDYTSGSDDILIDAELTGPYLGLSLVL